MAALDVVTLAEAKSALDVSHDNDNTNLAHTITAVSQLLDDQCGPIVARNATTTVWTTDTAYVDLHGPIDSVAALFSYTGDTGTQLSETTASAGYRLEPRTRGTGTYTGRIHAVYTAFGDYVTVNATTGRYSTTGAVTSRFKRAAFDIIRNLWRADEISVGAAGEFSVPYPTFPASYAIPNQVRDLLGEDWNGRRDSDAVGVTWG